MSMPKKLWRLGVTAVALLTLAACSRPFYVKPEGRLGQDVIFRFYEKPNDEKPAELNITQFAVQEQKEGASWNLVWGLTGKQSLTAITYGAKYDGLTEVTSAKPLSRGVKYRVVAADSPRFDPAGSAVAYFFFDESSALVVSGP